MGTPTAKLTWSGDSGSKSANGSIVVETRSRLYIVIDAVTLADVYNAIGLPGFNDPYEQGSPFKVKAITPTKKGGPTTWECRVDFGIPPLGDYPSQQVDLLQRPARVQWGQGFKQQPTDRDQSADGGRSIRNSAGDFFDPLPVRNIYVETLSIKKYFSFYDRAMARSFRNRVNLNAFTVGNTTLLPGECYCRNVAPTSEYEATVASIVEMEFAFEIDVDERSSDATKSGDPFDYHIVDQGSHGWYVNASGTKSPGFFCVTETVSGVERITSVVTNPVLLDGSGRPLNIGITLKVTDKPDGMGAIFTPTTGPADAAISSDYASTFDKPGIRRVWRFYGAQGADFSKLPL